MLKFAKLQDSIFLYTQSKGVITLTKDHELYKQIESLIDLDSCTEELILEVLNKHDANLEALAETTLNSLKSLIENNLDLANSQEQKDFLTESLKNRYSYLIKNGMDLKPLEKFIENLKRNPSKTSQKCLFDFIKACDLPITEDGRFLAYKAVSKNFKDLYTGTMDNTPGTFVWMKRTACTEDPQVSCASGLHVCSKAYLSDSYVGKNSKIIIVEVHPKDVVSVPYDYDSAKMRVCKYKVLVEAPNDFYKEDTYGECFGLKKMFVSTEEIKAAVEQYKETNPKAFVNEDIDWEDDDDYDCDYNDDDYDDYDEDDDYYYEDNEEAEINSLDDLFKYEQIKDFDGYRTDKLGKIYFTKDVPVYFKVLVWVYKNNLINEYHESYDLEKKFMDYIKKYLKEKNVPTKTWKNIFEVTDTVVEVINLLRSLN